MKVQTDGPDAMILLSWGIKEETKETEKKKGTENLNRLHYTFDSKTCLIIMVSSEVVPPK